MTFKWATVTAVAPLRVRVDGDSVALPMTPDSLVDPLMLSAADRVRVEFSNNRLVVVGVSGGINNLVVQSEELDIPWTPASGWTLDFAKATVTGKMAVIHVSCTRTGGTITATSSGNFPDSLMGTVGANWTPVRDSFLFGGSSGYEPFTARLNASRTFYLTGGANQNSVVVNTDRVQFQGTYRLA